MSKHLNPKPEQIDAFRKAVASGVPLKHALVNELGLSPTSAKRGRAAISKSVQAQLVKQGMDIYAEIGRSFDAEKQTDYIRGKAAMASLEGTDKGFNMLKLLAQDKRVAMLTPDSVAGIVVIEAPRSMPQPTQLAEPEHNQSHE